MFSFFPHHTLFIKLFIYLNVKYQQRLIYKWSASPHDVSIYSFILLWTFQFINDLSFILKYSFPFLHCQSCGCRYASRCTGYSPEPPPRRAPPPWMTFPPAPSYHVPLISSSEELKVLFCILDVVCIINTTTICGMDFSISIRTFSLPVKLVLNVYKSLFSCDLQSLTWINQNQLWNFAILRKKLFLSA